MKKKELEKRIKELEERIENLENSLSVRTKDIQIIPYRTWEIVSPPMYICSDNIKMEIIGE